MDPTTWQKENGQELPKRKPDPKNNDEIDFSLPYISPTMSYQRSSVLGFLKKKTNEKKFF